MFLKIKHIFTGNTPKEKDCKKEKVKEREKIQENVFLEATPFQRSSPGSAGESIYLSMFTWFISTKYYKRPTSF